MLACCDNIYLCKKQRGSPNYHFYTATSSNLPQIYVVFFLLFLICFKRCAIIKRDKEGEQGRERREWAHRRNAPDRYAHALDFIWILNAVLRTQNVCVHLHSSHHSHRQSEVCWNIVLFFSSFLINVSHADAGFSPSLQPRLWPMTILTFSHYIRFMFDVICRLLFTFDYNILLLCILCEAFEQTTMGREQT